MNDWNCSETKSSRAHGMLERNGKLDGASAEAASWERLFGPHAQQMLDLAKVVRLATMPPEGCGEGERESPAVTLAGFADTGILETMPESEYEVLLKVCDDLAVLWEGKSCSSGFTVACNAMLRTVMEDPALFAAVYVRTWDRLIAQGKRVVGIYTTQKERIDRKGWGQPRAS